MAREQWVKVKNVLSPCLFVIFFWKEKAMDSQGSASTLKKQSRC